MSTTDRPSTPAPPSAPVEEEAGGGYHCGVPGYPPCPNNAFFDARNEAIYRLAGSRTDKERILMAVRHVDGFLVGVLHSALQIIPAPIPAK